MKPLSIWLLNKTSHLERVGRGVREHISEGDAGGATRFHVDGALWLRREARAMQREHKVTAARAGHQQGGTDVAQAARLVRHLEADLHTRSSGHSFVAMEIRIVDLRRRREVT